MAQTSGVGPTALSGEQLAQMLALMKKSDSVELKLTVPQSERRSAITALEMDPLDAQIRQVYFFDTPDLDLNRHGVVVRARRVQGRPHDTIVKRRPVVPDELPDNLRLSPDFVVEVDAMPGGFVCSAALRAAVGPTDVHETIAGRQPIRKLFTKQQRAFFESSAPTGISLDDLSYLGPTFVLKLKMTPPELGRRLAAELWTYPDGSRILELSTKCLPSEAFQVAAEARAFLTSRGLTLAGEQETKTRKTLEFFSNELRAGLEEATT